MENKTNKLAVISLIINAVLIIAVIILFVKMPSAGGEEVVKPLDSDTTVDYSKMHEKGDNAVVVYYQSDSLNTRSKFVIELQEEIKNAQINAEKRLQAKQNELMSWDKKWQEKFPLISSEQERYMQEGQKKQEELMALQQQLEGELYETQNRLTIAGVTRISKYTKDLAVANGYDFVLSYQLGGQVLFCNPKMDITDELIEMMNADYDAGGTADTEKKAQ